jgi:hypothetical protein
MRRSRLTEDDRNATGTELADHVAHLLGILRRDALLVLAVRGRQNLGQLRIVEPDEVREVVQVRLVVVIRRAWLVKIGDQQAAPRSTIIGGRDAWWQETSGVLHIKVGLSATSRRILVQKASYKAVSIA